MKKLVFLTLNIFFFVAMNHSLNAQFSTSTVWHGTNIPTYSNDNAALGFPFSLNDTKLRVNATAPKNQYGVYTTIRGEGGERPLYALYAKTSGAGNFSGYFDGAVSFNTTEVHFNKESSGSHFLFSNSFSSDHELQIVPVIQGVADYGRGVKFTEKGEFIKSVTDGDLDAISVLLNGTEEFAIKGDGRAYAREILVTLDVFPDYVFEPTYDLLPLSELESYILKNRHLPNIPSAIEIEENNIGLGDLSLKQMEKIEELTLYVIELHKELEGLKEIIDTLQKNK